MTRSQRSSGELDAAGVPAAHADDHDGVLGRAGTRRRDGRRGKLAEQFGGQVRGQRGRCRVVEDQRGGQGQAGGGAELVAQVHRGERVEAEVAERLAGRDGVGSGVAEDRRRLGADHGEQALGPRPRRAGRATRRAARPPSHARPARRWRPGRLPRLGQFREQRRSAGPGEGRREPVPPHVGDGHRGLAGAERPGEGGEGPFGVHRGQPAEPQVPGHSSGGHAGPGAPGDREGGHAAFAEAPATASR